MLLHALRVALLSAGVLLSAAAGSIVLTPPTVVVKYGAPASANCSTNLPHQGMGWEASVGPVDMQTDVTLITWKVDSLTEWDIKPFCFINLDDGNQEQEDLKVVIYKVPDVVSINLNHSGPVIEGQTYGLLCSIQNVAPLNNLAVNWFKGQILIRTDPATGTSTTPKNTSASLPITATATDDGQQYRCEAELRLGPEGPQPSPKKLSTALRVNVNYGPKFSIPVVTYNQSDTELKLDCTVKANPPPTYTWKPVESSNAVLTVPPRSSGSYNCTATNQYGQSMKQFIIIPPSKDRTVFWAILGVGLAVVVVLCVGYLIFKYKSSSSII